MIYGQRNNLSRNPMCPGRGRLPVNPSGRRMLQWQGPSLRPYNSGLSRDQVSRARILLRDDPEFKFRSRNEFMEAINKPSSGNAQKNTQRRKKA